MSSDDQRPATTTHCFLLLDPNTEFVLPELSSTTTLESVEFAQRDTIPAGARVLLHLSDEQIRELAELSRAALQNSFRHG